MDIIFQHGENNDNMFSKLTDFVNASTEPLVHPEVPTVLHWEGFDQCKMSFARHPGMVADLITSAWRIDRFKDHKAVVCFVEGFTHIFITKDDIQLPDVWAKKVEGLA